MVVEAAAILDWWRDPDGGEAQILDVVELLDQALEVTAPVWIAGPDTVTVVVVVVRVAVVEARGQQEVDGFGPEVGAACRWWRWWRCIEGDRADRLAAGVDADLVAGVGIDREIAARIALAPVAEAIDLEARPATRVAARETLLDAVAAIIDRLHGSGPPAIRSAPEEPFGRRRRWRQRDQPILEQTVIDFDLILPGHRGEDIGPAAIERPIGAVVAIVPGPVALHVELEALLIATVE